MADASRRMDSTRWLGSRSSMAAGSSRVELLVAAAAPEPLARRRSNSGRLFHLSGSRRPDIGFSVPVAGLNADLCTVAPTGTRRFSSSGRGIRIRRRAARGRP